MPKNFYINDINSELVLAYKCFTKKESFDKLKSLLDLHTSKDSNEYYYQIRDLDRQPEYKNLSDEEKAARIIYLNKACFNGLYRVNKNGFLMFHQERKKKSIAIIKKTMILFLNIFLM
nr:DNA adenine methylase [Metamycoplasma hominis]